MHGCESNEATYILALFVARAIRPNAARVVKTTLYIHTYIPYIHTYVSILTYIHKCIQGATRTGKKPARHTGEGVVGALQIPECTRYQVGGFVRGHCAVCTPELGIA